MRWAACRVQLGLVQLEFEQCRFSINGDDRGGADQHARAGLLERRRADDLGRRSWDVNPRQRDGNDR